MMIMKDVNKLKMEATDMEAVNGGYFRTPSLELKVPKEVADSIGEYFRGELLTARGKCVKEVPLTARGKC